jgi:hypothetical protein
MSYSSYSINSRLSNLKSRSDRNDLKPLFVSVSEYEGLLEPDMYPFSFGYGSTSAAGFGLPISFKFNVLGFSLICDTPDENPEIVFQIEYYPFGSKTNPEVISTITLGTSLYVNVNDISKTYNAGIISVKVVSTENLTYDFSKYRLALNLQSEQTF